MKEKMRVLEGTGEISGRGGSGCGGGSSADDKSAFEMFYVDDDEDTISLESEGEFHEAIKLIREGETAIDAPLKIHV